MKTLSKALVILGVGTAAAFLTLGVTWLAQRRGVAFYTDGVKIHAPRREAPVRSVLWQPAEPVAGSVNTPADEYEARLSADGTLMVLVRGKPGANADLYQSRWTPENGENGGWATPTPIEGVNTQHDELGPELSRDGKALYFYSDRPGGLGGYDLWVSRAGESGWGEPVNLGPNVNTVANEYGPALTPDGTELYFASNRVRPGEPAPAREGWPATVREARDRHDYDLYVARLGPPPTGPEAATPVDELNSPTDEGAPSLSPVGDFLYFASDRAGGLGGFDVYRARRQNRTYTAPENLGNAVNSEANDLDPALSMDGFRLHFSSNRVVNPSLKVSAGEVKPPDYGVWVSHSREVYLEREHTGPSFAQLLGQVLPWLLLLFVALGLALLLMRMWANPALMAQFRKLSLLAQCLLISLALHVLIASLLTIWRVGAKISDMIKEPGGVKVVLASADMGEAGDGIGALLGGALTSESEAPALEVATAGLATPTIGSEAFTTEAAATRAGESQLTVATPTADAGTSRASAAGSQAELQRANETLTVNQPMAAPASASTEAAMAARADVPAAPGARPVTAPTSVERTAIDPGASGIPAAALASEAVRVADASDRSAAPSAPARGAEVQRTTMPTLAAAAPRSESAPAAVTEAAAPASPNAAAGAPPSAAPGQPALEPARVDVAVGKSDAGSAGARGNIAVEGAAAGVARGVASPAAVGSSRAVGGARSVSVGTPAAVAAGGAKSEAGAPEPTAGAAGGAGAPRASAGGAGVSSDRVDVKVVRTGTGETGAAAGIEVSAGSSGAGVGAATASPAASSAAPGTMAAMVGVGTPSAAGMAGAAKGEAGAPEASATAAGGAGVPRAGAGSGGVRSDRVDVGVASGGTREAGSAAGIEVGAAPSAAGVGAATASPAGTAAAPGSAPAAVSVGTPSAAGGAGVAKGEAGAPEVTAGAVGGVGAPRVGTEGGGARSDRVDVGVASGATREAGTSAGIEVGAAPSAAGVGTATASPAGSVTTPGTGTTAVSVATPAAAAPGGGAGAKSEPGTGEAGARAAGNAPAAAVGAAAPRGGSGTVRVDPGSARASGETSRAAVEGTTGGQPDAARVSAPAAGTPPLARGGAAAEVASVLPPEPPEPKETFPQRAPEVRTEMLERMGGSEESEKAVGRALEWFTRNQEADGRWAGKRHEAEIDCDAAMTGMALLCYLGAGHTPDKEGPYRANVSKGLEFLLSREDASGDLRRGETMYSQSIATVALCEAYGMTRDKRIGDAARRAVAFMCEGVKRAAANRQDARSRLDDTSVLGWQVMAMESARRSGFEVPETTFRSAREFLDGVSTRRSPGRYAYRPGEAPSAAMTAEAMFVQQLMGHSRDEVRMRESAEFILESPPRWRDGAYTYYWYYATLAMFQHQGDAWKQWNEALVPELLAHQRKDAPHAGSWDPTDPWSKMGGRVYQTAVCTLSLEVYYRYKPAE